MPTNNHALRIDHETAVASIKEIVQLSNPGRSHALAFLYGARAALIHGGIPDCFLDELDAEITAYERNRDLETEQVEALGECQENSAE